MNIGSVAGGLSAAADLSEFSVKVSEGAEDQQEKVVNKIMSSIDDSAPRNAGLGTGQVLNIKA